MKTTICDDVRNPCRIQKEFSHKYRKFNTRKPTQGRDITDVIDQVKPANPNSPYYHPTKYKEGVGPNPDYDPRFQEVSQQEAEQARLEHRNPRRGLQDIGGFDPRKGNYFGPKPTTIQTEPKETINTAIDNYNIYSDGNIYSDRTLSWSDMNEDNYYGI